MGVYNSVAEGTAEVEVDDIKVDTWFCAGEGDIRLKYKSTTMLEQYD